GRSTYWARRRIASILTQDRIGLKVQCKVCHLKGRSERDCQYNGNGFQESILPSENWNSTETWCRSQRPHGAVARRLRSSVFTELASLMEMVFKRASCQAKTGTAQRPGAAVSGPTGLLLEDYVHRFLQNWLLCRKKCYIP